MREQVGQCAIEPGGGRKLRHDNSFDRLNLAEVVASTDRAECTIERSWRKTGIGHRLRNVALPRRIEDTEASGRLIEAKLANGNIELEEPHAAADVGADELRMNPIC